MIVMKKEITSNLIKNLTKTHENVSDKFKHTISLSGVIIISLSSMLGSGLFVMPTFAADIMGPGIWLAFLIAASIVLPGAALVVGVLTYFSYGNKHAHPRETPFNSFRKQFVNPTPNEHDKRLAVFHAADFGGKNHLTLKEFQNALKSLGFDYNSDESRLIFHKGDSNEDGVIDIDEFIETFETMEE